MFWSLFTQTEGAADRYATEVDIDFVRKSVRTIGRLAIKVPAAADLCIHTLLQLLETKIDYVVQEVVVVIRDIFRRYPNKYESVIPTLCENMNELTDPEPKSAIVWILGQYADRIDNATELLDDLAFTFLEEPTEVSCPACHLSTPLSSMAVLVGSAVAPNSRCQAIHSEA